MNKTGSGGVMSSTRGEASKRPCCQDFCECLWKMADVSDMFGLGDACRGLFSRAKSTAEGARRQGRGTADGTDTPSAGDPCPQDGTRLDHLIAELRANMIDLISLDVDVLRQFLHVYEEIEDLKLQRQFASDGYDTASTYSYESGSSVESLQSVGRPLSGGFDNAMTYQSRGSRFLEVPRRGGSCSPKLGSPRLRRPLSDSSGTFCFSQSTTKGESSPIENSVAMVASEEHLLSGTSGVAGKQKGSSQAYDKHYSQRTTDNTRVHTVSHDLRMLSLADDRQLSVPSIEVTSVQDSQDQPYDHSTRVGVHADGLLTTKTSLQDAVTSQIPPQLPKKERKGKVTPYQSNGDSYQQGLDEETARLIRTCEEYMLISDRASQSIPVNNKIKPVPNVQSINTYQNGYNQSWSRTNMNFSLSDRRNVDVTPERTRPVCRIRPGIEAVHDHVGSACAQGEGDYMVMLPIIRVSGH
ncbi:uncharacterized protein LOC118432478 [Branchiostoma floridae]|uniref:Uncharacterized protein LOC118432478 n=1 Tax=Branchiostoma floridae TaxID=7739 RepID=A0A9J7MEU5_BRAFL|nr:uncharacterized protein LOC118432478 [Branchiostoma floridae]